MANANGNNANANGNDYNPQNDPHFYEQAIAIAMEMGCTEDEAEMMVEDFLY